MRNLWIYFMVRLNPLGITEKFTTTPKKTLKIWRSALVILLFTVNNYKFFIKS